MTKFEDISAEALEAFALAHDAQKDDREACRADRRFCSVPGAQWEGVLGEFFENKPKFEINKVQLAVTRIFNEYRNNRIIVDFVPKDGVEDDDLSDLCDDLFRADVDASGGMDAFDNAFDEAIAGGIGAWRLVTEYVDEGDPEDDRQQICFEPIYDADISVYFDVNSKKQDKSDAKCAFVIYTMSRKAFEKEFPDESPTDWPRSTEGGATFDWCTPDVVYLCEYYKIVEQTETIHVWADVTGEEQRYSEDEIEEDGFVDDLLAKGSTFVRTRKVKRQRCQKYLLSGGGVLEDMGEIAGRHIPIVMVYGKRLVIDGKERAQGHVRVAKDPLRIKNIETSRLVEIAAASPYEVPIVTPEQITGHELQWAQGNQKNEPFRLINPVIDENGQEQHLGPVGYTKSPDIPQALGALLQIAEQDINDVLGNQQAGEEIEANVSGKAVELVQNRLDMQTFIYMDNMRKAMKRCGEIWLDMAKEIYVEKGRKLRVLGKDGTVAAREIGEPVIGPDGDVVMGNDLSRAKFGVKVEVGPATSSRRAATVRAVTGLLQMTADPMDQKILTSVALMNIEGEGMSDLREFKRKELVQMGVLPPTEADEKEMEAAAQNQQPDPQAEYLMAEAQKAAAQAEQARANTGKAVADAEKARAQTAAILAEIPRADQTAAVDNATKIGQAIGQGQTARP